MKKLLFLLLLGVSAFGQKQPTGGASQGTADGQLLELQAIKAKFSSLGQKNMANSTPVVFSSDQSSIPVNISNTIFTKSVGNCSNAQLAAAGIFTGTLQDVILGKGLLVSVRADQNITVSVHQYIDAAGTQLVETNTYTRLANAPLNVTVQMNSNYAKVVVTNTGGAATANLVVDTYFGDMPPLPSGVTNLGNFKVSTNEINGSPISTNAGNADAGTKRVVIATNQVPLQHTTQGAFNTNAYTRSNINVTNVVQTIKATVGNIYGLSIRNDNSTIVYVKFFDAVSVTLGTTAPTKTIAVPPNYFVDIQPNVVPYEFFNSNSIKVAVVTGSSDSDVTAPTIPVFIQTRFN